MVLAPSANNIFFGSQDAKEGIFVDLEYAERYLRLKELKELGVANFDGEWKNYDSRSVEVIRAQYALEFVDRVKITENLWSYLLNEAKESERQGAMRGMLFMGTVPLPGTALVTGVITNNELEENFRVQSLPLAFNPGHLSSYFRHCHASLDSEQAPLLYVHTHPNKHPLPAGVDLYNRTYVGVLHGVMSFDGSRFTTWRTNSDPYTIVAGNTEYNSKSLNNLKGTKR